MPGWDKIKKLRFDEGRVRGAQKLAVLAERRGWASFARLPGDAELLALVDRENFDRGLSLADNLLDHFRSRTEPECFAGLDAANAETATIDQLRTRWPQASSEIVERA